MAILSSAFDLPAGRLLALDLGQARTGVAVCDETGTIVTPLVVLRRHPTRAQDYAEIVTLAARERVTGVLVGLPLNLVAPRSDALRSDALRQARWVRRYAGRLAAVLAVPVAFWDETLSTVDALALKASGHSRAATDAVAAAVLLGDFLEARRTRRTVTEHLS